MTPQSILKTRTLNNGDETISGGITTTMSCKAVTKPIFVNN